MISIIRVVLVFMIVLFVSVAVLAEEDPAPPSELPDEVVFVEGGGTLDHFVNDTLNSIRDFFLATIAPAIGLVVVGRNVAKRLFAKFIPDSRISSAWVGLIIMGVLFVLYKLAGAADATAQLQTVVDVLTTAGELFFVSGITVVASSAVYDKASWRDNTIFGYSRPPRSSNG